MTESPELVAIRARERANTAERSVAALESLLRKATGEIGALYDVDYSVITEAKELLASSRLETNRNQADAAPSDAVLSRPTPKGSLPNSLGASTPANRTTEQDFEHWLSYSGYSDLWSGYRAGLRAAYFAGASAVNVTPK